MNRLWGSWWDGYPRTVMRIGIAVIVGLEQLVETFQVDWQSRAPDKYPPTGALSRWLAEVPGAAWILFALIGVGLVAVARDRRPIAGGLWALAWAAVLSEWQTQIFGSPSRNAFFPGAVLLGWTLGQAWAVSQGARADAEGRALRERLGEAGALACLAAAYVGSGLSKLLTAGVSWADGAQIRALVLQQQPVARWQWLAAYREAFVVDPHAAVAASVGTLVLECGGLLLLFGPRLRLAWATLLVGLHINITLLCTMPYLEPMLLLPLTCVPWPRVFRREPGAVAAAPAGPVVPRPMAVALLALVVLAWLAAPWGWRATG